MTDPREQILSTPIPTMPEHVAIIMDGNNRWARQHNFAGIAGHKAGVEAVKAVLETSVHYQIKVLTLFAFSSENWRRPKQEVKALMELLRHALKSEVNKLSEHNVRLRVIGLKEGLSKDLQKLIAKAETVTQNNTGLQLNIALNYGGRWDIVNAAKQAAMAVQQGDWQVDDITEDSFNTMLCLGELPPVDLCIRTSGEQRISNFLLWQLAYAEFVFADQYWPDFQHQAFVDTLLVFSQRQRRFGQTSEQLIASAENSS